MRRVRDAVTYAQDLVYFLAKHAAVANSGDLTLSRLAVASARVAQDAERTAELAELSQLLWSPPTSGRRRPAYVAAATSGKGRRPRQAATRRHGGSNCEAPEEILLPCRRSRRSSVIIDSTDDDEDDNDNADEGDEVDGNNCNENYEIGDDDDDDDEADDNSHDVDEKDESSSNMPNSASNFCERLVKESERLTYFARTTIAAAANKYLTRSARTKAIAVAAENSNAALRSLALTAVYAAAALHVLGSPPTQERLLTSGVNLAVALGELLKAAVAVLDGARETSRWIDDSDARSSLVFQVVQTQRPWNRVASRLRRRSSTATTEAAADTITDARRLSVDPAAVDVQALHLSGATLVRALHAFLDRVQASDRLYRAKAPPLTAGPARSDAALLATVADVPGAWPESRRASMADSQAPRRALLRRASGQGVAAFRSAAAAQCAASAPAPTSKASLPPPLPSSLRNRVSVNSVSVGAASERPNPANARRDLPGGQINGKGRQHDATGSGTLSSAATLVDEEHPSMLGARRESRKAPREWASTGDLETGPGGQADLRLQSTLR